MVEGFLYALFDEREIYNHAVFVELARTAIYGDDGVMAMQTGAFTGVGKGEVVGKCNFYAFLNVVHGVDVLKVWIE